MATTLLPDAEGCIDFKCATDLSAAQYHGVKLSAAMTVAIGDADGDLLAGVLMNAPNGSSSGTNPGNTTAKVFTLVGGIVPVYAGAAISTVGSPLTTDSSGHWIGASDGDVICGYALETAGASGDVIRMLYTGPQHESNVSIYTTGS